METAVRAQMEITKEKFSKQGIQKVGPWMEIGGNADLK